jgi:hypothetical protein
MEADSPREVILWLKVILFIFFDSLV